jgi:mannose-6-phosphate isomerase-like protein (cupin superfamily)
MNDKTKAGHRPWGRFETHATLPDACLKTLHLNPGARLSLQSHARRKETWLLLSGDAQATVGSSVQDLTTTELAPDIPFSVPVGMLHRLASKGGCVIAEVAYGAFDEEDIIRYQDDYGRTTAYEN